MAVLYLASSLLAIAGFAAALIAPGYLVARLCRLPGFAQGSAPEQLLWSVVLSAPLATMVTVLCGPLLGSAGVGLLFVGCDVAAVSLWLRSKRPASPAVPRSVGMLAAAVAAFLLLAGAPVRIGDRLWEPIASADWSVRVPLIASMIRQGAIHGGMSPINPFYAVDGHIVPLHYYWYWYALCGVIGRCLGLPARALIQAGAVWAAWLMLATLFLLLRTLFRPAHNTPGVTWSRLCWGACLALPVLGFDVLQVAYEYVANHALWPEPEWWRAPSTGTPSFQTMFLYAPHHTFGVCSCLAGYLLLVVCTRACTSLPVTRGQVAAAAVLAGICFAALVGTSTYVAVCFCVVGVLLTVERAFARDGKTLVTLAVAAIVATALSVPFLRLMLAPQPGSVHQQLVVVALRGWVAVKVWALQQPWVYRLPAAWQNAVRVLLYLALAVSETGFLLLVYLHRARADLRQRGRLSERSRLQWVLALGFLLPALLFTSEPAIHSNDLGFHAAFVLRVVGVLWAAPVLAAAVWNPGWRSRALRSWQGRVAAAFILLGVLTQVWQAGLQRFGLPLAGNVLVSSPLPSPPDIGERTLAAFQANAAVDRLLPRDARLLTNPWSRQRSMGMLYLDRQTVAPEPGCMAAFGGNPATCIQSLPSLADLFGERLTGPQADLVGMVGNPSTARGFAQVCRQQHATAVLVSADDAAWHSPAGWVWTQPAVYSSARERVLLCPGSTD